MACGSHQCSVLLLVRLVKEGAPPLSHDLMFRVRFPCSSDYMTEDVTYRYDSLAPMINP